MFEKQMNARYALELQIVCQERKLQTLEAAWTDAVAHRIEIIEQLSDLENFSIASFRAWLRGDRAARIQQLRRDVTNAESAVKRARWQLDNEKQELQQLRLEREALPATEEIQRWVQEKPTLLPQYCQLEIKLCLAVLPVLLEKNIEGLTALYEFLRGGRAGEILSIEQQQRLFAQPDESGQQCAIWLQRLQKAREGMAQKLEIPTYYENPQGYIVSAAAQFNRIDRARNALDQACAVRRAVDSLEKGRIQEMFYG